MKIIFKTQEVPQQPTFADVKINQFFVNIPGNLCQKYCSDSYNIITTSNGYVCGGRVDNLHPNSLISRILPEVSMIEY
jgi:hypothetical protein